MLIKMKAQSRSPSGKVVIAAVITAICLLGDSMLYIILPLYWPEFGLNHWWEVGALLSVNRLVRIPLHPLVGWFYRLFKVHHGFGFAVVLTFVTTLSYGLINGFWYLLIMRALWGVAWAFLKQGGQLVIIDSLEQAPSASGKLTGMYNGIYRIGSLAAMLIGGLMVGIVGAPVLFYSFSFAALMTIPLMLAIRHSKYPAAPQEKQVRASFTKQKLSRRLSITLVSGFIIALIYQGMITSTASYWISERHNEIIALLGGVSAAGLAGILLALRWVWEPFIAPWIGNVTDQKYSRVNTIIYTSLVASVLFILLPIQIPIFLWLTVVLFLLVTATFLTTLSDAEASEQAMAGQKNKVVASYTMAADLGAGIGPLVSYLSIEWFGEAAISWSAALLLFLLAVMWGRIHIKEGSNGMP